MSRRKQILGVGFLFAAAISVPAYAQPSAQTYAQCTKTITTNDSDLAHQKYIAGKQDYDEGNYESAIRRFRDAYTLDCTKHELLIIISAAYERRGDKKEAVAALETYVARAAASPDVGTYQAKIENLKKQIAAAPSASATPTTPATATTGTAPAPAAETREHTVYPWVLVGVGGAAIVVGGVLLATTPALPSNCVASTEKCTKVANESDKDLANDRSQAALHVGQNLAGILVMGGGALLAIGGLVWRVLEPTGPKESTRAKVTPSVGAGYAGLSLGGNF